uniref:Hint domain-containing protein n=1 Tax=Romanomermis culicivorax TaxID=13658 RepID=A0A915JBI8_ROMCU
MMKIADVAADSKSLIQVLSRDDTGRLIFSPIKSWLHAEPDREQVFLVFQTEHGQRLLLTKNHLIYCIDCSNDGPPQAIFADRLQPGQCVLVTAPNSRNLIRSRIRSRTSEIKRGVYAPITRRGNLIVD